jgi:hypothetical protein
MQGDDPEVLKAVESKLVALARCVVRKAKEDPAFAEELREILVSDSLLARMTAKRPATTKPVFNPVAYLQLQGRDGLRSELEGKPASELSDIIRSHRIVKGKAAKVIERPAMIDAIVAYSERSLNQGGAFLRDRRGGEVSSADDPGKNLARPPDELTPLDDSPHPTENESRPSDDRVVEDE